MTKKEKIKRIINILRREVDCAIEEYANSLGRFRAAEEAEKQWKKNNPDDGIGSMGRNPYHVDIDREIWGKKMERMNNIKEVLEFANDTFLDMIEEE